MGKTVEVRTYDSAQAALFCKTTERFGGLSNMAGGFSLRVNGINILTSEALYQACRFPHLPEVQRLIIALGRGQDTFTKEDAAHLLEWAEAQRLSNGIVDNLLNGDFIAAIDSTGEPHFRLSDKGVRSAEALR